MQELSIKNLKVSYHGDVVAISSFSLNVEFSCVAVLMGAIGCGKSSVLRAIAGLVNYEGEIRLCGEDIASKRIRDRNFVYASFDSPLFANKTVLYNLKYGLMLRKESSENIDNKLQSNSKVFALDGLLLKKIRHLTALERRKLILARAFMRDADVYLINDPAQGLTDAERRFVFGAIKDSFFGKKAVLVMSTSDFFDVADSEYNLVMIKDGTKVFEGGVEKYKECPPDLSTALFASSENLYVTSGEIQKITHRGEQILKYKNRCHDKEELEHLDLCAYQKTDYGSDNAGNNVFVACDCKQIANSKKILVFDANKKLLCVYKNKNSAHR